MDAGVQLLCAQQSTHFWNPHLVTKNLYKKLGAASHSVQSDVVVDAASVWKQSQWKQQSSDVSWHSFAHVQAKCFTGGWEAVVNFTALYLLYRQHSQKCLINVSVLPLIKAAHEKMQTCKISPSFLLSSSHWNLHSFFSSCCPLLLPPLCCLSGGRFSGEICKCFSVVQRSFDSMKWIAGNIIRKSIWLKLWKCKFFYQSLC